MLSYDGPSGAMIGVPILPDNQGKGDGDDGPGCHDLWVPWKVVESHAPLVLDVGVLQPLLEGDVLLAGGVTLSRHPVLHRCRFVVS